MMPNTFIQFISKIRCHWLWASVCTSVSERVTRHNVADSDCLQYVACSSHFSSEQKTYTNTVRVGYKQHSSKLFATELSLLVFQWAFYKNVSSKQQLSSQQLSFHLNVSDKENECINVVFRWLDWSLEPKCPQMVQILTDSQHVKVQEIDILLYSWCALHLETQATFVTFLLISNHDCYFFRCNIFICNASPSLCLSQRWPSVSLKDK